MDRAHHLGEPVIEVLLPKGGRGRGVLLAHAWWGLNQTIRDYGAALAREGFVVGLVDLFDGQVAHTIEGAEALASKEWPMPARDHLKRGIKELAKHPAVEGGKVGAVGFSYSGFALFGLASHDELPLGGIVIYYATRSVAKAKVPLLVHFAETDAFESTEDMKEVSDALAALGAPSAAYTYQDTAHWFAEPDRPEYREATAALAFERTVGFLKRVLA